MYMDTVTAVMMQSQKGGLTTYHAEKIDPVSKLLLVL